MICGAVAAPDSSMGQIVPKLDYELKTLNFKTSQPNLQKILLTDDTLWSASQPALRGIGTEGLWLWFRIDVQASQPGRWTLTNSFALIDEMRLFVPTTADGYAAMRMGTIVPSEEKIIGLSEIQFPLGEVVSDRPYYLATKTTGAVRISPRLTPTRLVQAEIGSARLFVGTAYGIMLVAVIVAGIMFARYRSRLFFWFGILSLGSLMTNFIALGIGHEALHGSLGGYLSNIANGSSTIVVVALVFFTLELLSDTIKRGRMHKFIIRYTILVGFCGVVATLYRSPLTITIHSLNCAAMALISTGVALSQFTKTTHARSYVYGIVLFCLGAVVLVSNLRIFTDSIFLEYALLVGCVGQLGFFAIGISHRLSLEKQRHEALQNEAMEHLERLATLEAESNSILEKAVHERTRDLQAANDQIMESLNYARSIQVSGLPRQETLESAFEEFFVIWEPRDQVGGDLYWAYQTSDAFLFAVLDCTGHGVPGALMTMTVKSILDQLAARSSPQDPGEMLQALNSTMKKTLNQNYHDTLSDDGVDIALCSVHNRDSFMLFAGAKLNLLVCRDNDVETIKGSRQSVGYKRCAETYRYESHRIDFAPGQSFYLLSDGLRDQLGDQGSLPFGAKKGVQRTIAKTAPLPMKDQKVLIWQGFRSFRGNHDQLDDVTLVGFKPKAAA